MIVSDHTTRQADSCCLLMVFHVNRKMGEEDRQRLQKEEGNSLRLFVEACKNSCVLQVQLLRSQYQRSEWTIHEWLLRI